MAEFDGALDHSRRNAFAAHREMHVDADEHLGVGVGAFAAEFDRAAAHRMPAAFKHQHHVVSGAAASTSQQQLHGPRRQVLAALVRLVRVGRAVHGHQVTAAGFGHKTHGRTGAARAGPTDGAFHDFLLLKTVRLSASLHLRICRSKVTFAIARALSLS